MIPTRTATQARTTSRDFYRCLARESNPRHRPSCTADTAPQWRGSVSRRCLRLPTAHPGEASSIIVTGTRRCAWRRSACRVEDQRLDYPAPVSTEPCRMAVVGDTNAPACRSAWRRRYSGASSRTNRYSASLGRTAAGRRARRRFGAATASTSSNPSCRHSSRPGGSSIAPVSMLIATSQAPA